MLIVLEGPDGAGKSTLAREINDIIGRHAPVEMLHAGPLTGHPLDAYELPIASYRPGTRHIICDRWHLGEMVYPTLFDRATRWDDAVAQHIHMFLQSRGACVVVLNPGVEELRTRLEVRGDALIKPRHIDSIVRSYEKIPSVFIDIGGSATPKSIIKRARIAHLNAIKLNRFETYVGPPNPKVLILGDERAFAARKRAPGLGAFMPYRNTSGHFLLKHLARTGAYIHTIGLANACDADNPSELWEVLGRPKVVTLGSNAHEKLVRQDIPHGAVPHPQFIRRFHVRSGTDYVLAISQAASSREDLRTWRP